MPRNHPTIVNFHTREEEKFWKIVPVSVPGISKSPAASPTGQPSDEGGDTNEPLLLGPTNFANLDSASDGGSYGRGTESAVHRELRLTRLLDLPTVPLGTPMILGLPPPLTIIVRAVEDLRRTAWNGIPARLRPLSWKLMMGYLPVASGRRDQVLQRKRAEYKQIVRQHFGGGCRKDEAILHQISIDVPRTAPDVKLFRNSFVREALIRILYCWSIRRPASGYVQGINDLVVPFYDVFLTEHLPPDLPIDEQATVSLPEETLFNVEADCFWCFSKLLDSIQDNYTFSQVGISRQLHRMQEIVRRTDNALMRHLEAERVSLLQFAFRWMNCLLMREFPLHMVIRMWDTYMAEGEQGFSEFHTYICAAFLSRWSDQLQLLEFQDILLFLQSPPTALWSLDDIEMLLSEAYVWKSLFHDSQGHLGTL